MTDTAVEAAGLKVDSLHVLAALPSPRQLLPRADIVRADDAGEAV